jgi:hypothetical protein
MQQPGRRCPRAGRALSVGPDLWRIRPVLKLIGLGFLVWSFWNPAAAALAFVILIGAVEGWAVFGVTNATASAVAPESWSPEERQALRRYALYFRYPLTCRSLSSAISLFQLSAFVWVPWLLYGRLWWQAGVLASNYYSFVEVASEDRPPAYNSSENARPRPRYVAG